jgi:hypothetical protein
MVNHRVFSKGDKVTFQVGDCERKHYTIQSIHKSRALLTRPNGIFGSYFMQDAELSDPNLKFDIPEDGGE